MIRKLLVSVAATALLAACSTTPDPVTPPPVAEAPMVQLVQDIHTYARPN